MKTKSAIRFTAILSLFLVLLGISAYILLFSSSKGLYLKESRCGQNCSGHVITKNTSVTVISGSHNITLKNAIIDTSEKDGVSALKLEPGTHVWLTLEGENSLTTSDAPGILLSEEATIIISEAPSATLDIASGGSPAINGSDDGFGYMRIESGTINVRSIGMLPAIHVAGGSLHITGGNVQVAGDQYSSALQLSDHGTLQLENGSFLTESDNSYAIFCQSASVSVSGGELHADSGEISNSIYAEGDSSFTLTNGSMVATNGIRLCDNSTFSVNGGQLTVSGRSISLLNKSTFHVNGGVVVAKSTQAERCGFYLTSATASLNISGGSVTAYGWDSGIGISSGTVNISGGNLTAEGTNCGIEGNASGRSGNVVITGGNVVARGKEGILVNNLRITDGNLEATGNGRSAIHAAKLEILGGNVTAEARSNTSASIGVGKNDIAFIRGGKITASGSSHASGIGSAYDSCGEITIEGGEVIAKGGRESSGISLGGFDSAGTLTITGGTVTATGGTNAAGIGSSQYSTGGKITILGGNVTAIGGLYAAGMGGGRSPQSSGGSISVSSGEVNIVRGKDAENAVNAVLEHTGGKLIIDGIELEL